MDEELCENLLQRGHLNQEHFTFWRILDDCSAKANAINELINVVTF